MRSWVVNLVALPREPLVRIDFSHRVARPRGPESHRREAPCVVLTCTMGLIRGACAGLPVPLHFLGRISRS